MFTFNRIVGFIIMAALVYRVLQTFGFLPAGAPVLFPRRSGPPAA
jgi:hypothetical protein